MKKKDDVDRDYVPREDRPLPRRGGLFWRCGSQIRGLSGTGLYDDSVYAAAALV